MFRYFTKDGSPTTADDPHRLVWYAAGTTCGFWTDNWETLSDLAQKGHSPIPIPCCPTCGCVGYQEEAGVWLEAAKKFEERNNERGYFDFLMSIKGRHLGRPGLMETWLRKKNGTLQEAQTKNI